MFSGKRFGRMYPRWCILLSKLRLRRELPLWELPVWAVALTKVVKKMAAHKPNFIFVSTLAIWICADFDRFSFRWVWR